MPGTGKSKSRGLIGLILVLVLCLACTAVGALLVGMQQAAGELGPAAEGLDPLQRTLLSAYLIANEPSLKGPAGDPTASYDLEVSPGETAGDVPARFHHAGI